VRRRRPAGGLPVLSANAILLDAKPRLAPGIEARRIDFGGRGFWVFRNPATGRYFRATPRLYLLAAGLDGRSPVRAVLATLPPAGEDGETAETLLDGLAAMIAAGVVTVSGARPPAPPARGVIGLLSRVAFTRVRLGDLGRAMPLLGPLLGWLYTRAGATALLLLIGLAAWSWAGRGAELAEQFARFADITLHDVLVGYLIFAATKLLHEGGHAVALRRMAAAEGLRTGPIAWGISFMFLLPAPFVEASAAWMLRSPWRRAVVGLAGVATDLTIAALAAIAWSMLGPGALRDRAFDIVVICSVSSLLFNLNPLAKLDGYYVLSDLLGVPNLLARAQAALGRFVFGPFGLAPRPRMNEAHLALYALGSWTYRWTIYLGIFWLAGGVHWLLAGGVFGVAAVLFLGLPLVRLALATPRAFGRAPVHASVFAAVVAAVLAAVFLVPLPQQVVAEGVVVRQGLALVYAPADGRVAAVAPAGAEPAGATVLRLENPETERLLTQLRAEALALSIAARRARAEGAERVDAAIERQQAVARQIAALEAERAASIVATPRDAWWEPLRAEPLQDGWVRRDDSRPLGALLSEGPAMVHLVLDQWDGPAALAALAARTDPRLPLRLRGAGAAMLEGRPAGPAIEARDSLPSPALALAAGGRIQTRRDDRGEERPAERVFELRVAPEGAGADAWRHGARVEALLDLRPAPLAEQVWRRARQALQRRLAV
jgi:putative peptide zinc metalloprotease protein